MGTNARLELTWPNKAKFLLAPEGVDGRPVWVERDHPAAHEVRLSEFTGAVGEVDEGDPYAANLLFTGDSLDVLRILCEVPEYRRHYRGKIKLIYIDPPFNTGQTFEHYDDWMEHSTWLSFMRDRLVLMRELLAPDGSIWVHLDDAEVHRMRCLLDEVFGGPNCIATVVWQKADSPRMDAKQFSTSHDTLLIYGRNPNWEPNRRDQEEVDTETFQYVEPDGRRFNSSPLRKWGTNSARADRPNLWYPITGPDGVEYWPIKPDGTEGNWRWQASKVAADAHLLHWIDKGSGMQPYVKEYADSERKPLPPVTWWDNSEYGHNRSAKAHSKQLFGRQQAFATPKPEQMLAEVIFISTGASDIVLDIFGGSGTTAAVAQKMGRRWVTAEILPETVAAFTRPRLEKVVAGEDPGGITESVGWAGGGGFRCVEVGPSMYEVDEDLVLLAPWATNGKFAKAVAGQLGFEWQSKKHAPFCGVRGRMRLAVLDGAVGPEEVREITSALGEGERVTIVAKVVLPETEEVLRDISKGSRVRKAPRDLLVDSARKGRRGGAR